MFLEVLKKMNFKELIKSKVLWLFLLSTIFGFNMGVYAHPGNTASDGCHYCRTNCDYWGVEWDVRHCHNDGYVQEDYYDPDEEAVENWVEPVDPEPDYDSYDYEDVADDSSYEASASTSASSSTDTSPSSDNSLWWWIGGGVLLWFGGAGISEWWNNRK